MPKSTLKKKAKKSKCTYKPGHFAWGAPKCPKNVEERMGPILHRMYGVSADEDWTNYVEIDKKFEKIFCQQMKLLHEEWQQYVVELKKYLKKTSATSCRKS